MENLKIVLELLKTPRYKYTALAGLLGLLTAVVLWIVLPENGTADLYEYYGVTAEETVVFLNSDRADFKVLRENGAYYLPLDTVQAEINSRFYNDEETAAVLYALPQETSEFHPDDASGVLIKRGGTLYIALATVKEYTALEYREYNIAGQPRRLWIWTAYGEKITGTIVAKDTDLRTDSSKFGRVITDESIGTEVLILSEKGRWMYVLTEDGHMGYIRKKHLLESREIVRTNDTFTEQDYGGRTFEGTVSLGFDYIDNVSYGLDVLRQHLEAECAVNVLAPTWFVLYGADGEFNSCADPAYVATAHENGLQVWIMIENMTCGCDTEALLKSRTARTNLVNNLTEAVEACGADGINLDFESMAADLVPHYLEFIRELKQACIRKNIVLSCDTFSPYSWNLKYDHTELGKILDYVIIMGYDESWEKPGPNSDKAFIDFSCARSLEMIPAEKLIMALPFYTRAWAETENGWSRAEVYMRDCASLMESCADAEWDEEKGCYHGHVEIDGVTKEIWFEDLRSMETRLNVVSGYVLKGVAFWRLGQEDTAVWELVRDYIK